MRSKLGSEELRPGSKGVDEERKPCTAVCAKCRLAGSDGVELVAKVVCDCFEP